LSILHIYYYYWKFEYVPIVRIYAVIDLFSPFFFVNYESTLNYILKRYIPGESIPTFVISAFKNRLIILLPILLVSNKVRKGSKRLSTHVTPPYSCINQVFLAVAWQWKMCLPQCCIAMVGGRHSLHGRHCFPLLQRNRRVYRGAAYELPEQIRYIVPSLRLFVPNSLTVHHISSFWGFFCSDWLRLGDWGVRVKVPVGSRIFLSSSRPPLRPTLASSPVGTRSSFPSSEVDHSPPGSTEVKKTWIYTFTLPHAFMARCLIS
jgi:hypothetical protein